VVNTEQVLREREEILAEVEGRTLVDVFMATCDANGGKPALVVKEGDGFRTRTWAEYRHEASQVAMALRRAGVDHGDFVALMMTNRPSTSSPTSARCSPAGRRCRSTTRSRPSRSATSPTTARRRSPSSRTRAFLDRWTSIRDDLPGLELIVVLEADGVDLDRDGVTSYERFVATGAEALAGGQGELENSWRAVKPDDPLTLIYTSGTTGPPKGVILTHRNLLFMLGAAQRASSTSSRASAASPTCRSRTSPSG
jgi:long-chain acyl-CoA synthetase